MIILPAIDIFNGKVVRLVKGDPEQSTVYSDEPVAFARKWQEAGAQWLHIVNLSAALGQQDNSEVIKEIISQVDIAVEVGGGIRTVEKIDEFLQAGAQRVILGTKALDDAFLSQALQAYGSERIAVGVDARGGYVAVQGWKEKTKVKAHAFVEYMYEKGVRWIIYTDISRDGTLTGVNLAPYQQFSHLTGLNYIVSGGVSSLDDIKAIKQQLPLAAGVIIGKALYEGAIDITEALQV